MTTDEMISKYERRAKKLRLRVLCAETEKKRTKYEKELRSCESFLNGLKAMKSELTTPEGVRMEMR